MEGTIKIWVASSERAYQLLYALEELYPNVSILNSLYHVSK